MVECFHIYGRLSLYRDGPLSPTEVQDDDCRRWVAQRGGRVVGSYLEPGKSAHLGETFRPGYEALLDEVRLGHVQNIVVTRMDRLARYLGEYEALIRLCKRHDVVIWSLEGFDTRTPFGRKMGRTLVSEAHSENDNRTARIDTMARARARAGVPPTRGYYGLNETCTAINEQEASLVREAARRLLEGEGTTSISRDWTARGVAKRNGTPFAPNDIRYMLQHRSLTGDRIYAGEVLAEDVYPAVLDRLTAAKVRAKFTSETYPRRGRNQPKGCLIGLATCGSCGQRLTLMSLRQPDYRCRSSRECPAPPVIDQTILEDWVQHHVAQRLRCRGRRTGRRWNQDSAIEQLRALEACTDALHVLNRAYFSQALITRHEWLQMRDTLVLTKAQRVARIGLRRPEGLPRRVSLASMADAWDSLDNNTKHDVIALEVGRVVVYPVPDRRQSSTATRVRFEWLLPDPPDWPAPPPRPPRRRTPNQWSYHGARATPSDAIPSADELRARGGPYSKAETARLLDCSSSTINRLCQRGLLVADKTTRIPAYSAEAIDELLSHYRIRRQIIGTEDEIRAERARRRAEADARRRAERRAVYTLKDLAALLRLPYADARRLVLDGEIPAAQVNGLWRIPIDRFDRWLEQRATQPGGHAPGTSMSAHSTNPRSTASRQGHPWTDP